MSANVVSISLQRDRSKTAAVDISDIDTECLIQIVDRFGDAMDSELHEKLLREIINRQAVRESLVIRIGKVRIRLPELSIDQIEQIARVNALVVDIDADNKTTTLIPKKPVLVVNNV